MSALVVDTSSWIDYLDGKEVSHLESALAEGRVFVPPVVAAELMSGVRGRRARSAIRDLLADLPLCACDLEHWLRVGELRADLAVKGFTVSTPDAHVARCALDLDGELLSGDGIFREIRRLAGLRLAGD